MGKNNASEKWLTENRYLDFDAVVLANGDFPKHHVPISVLRDARYLVCCDAAAKTLLEHENLEEKASFQPSSNSSITPLSNNHNKRQLKIDAVIGDGDSLPEEMKRALADIYHHFEEQDYNDLTKATRFIVNKFNKQNLNKSSHSATSPHPIRIAYLGATGKREDHTLGNISLLKFYSQTFGIEPVLFTDYGVFSVHLGNATIPTFPNQQISIFNINCKSLESEGLRWAASPFSEWWMGTLNEALDDSVTIKADNYFLLYRVYEKKGRV